MRSDIIHTVIRSVFAGFLLFAGTGVPVSAQEAMKQQGSDTFFERILSLPKAVMYERPNTTSAKLIGEVPAFSVYYVYEHENVEGKDWVRVGNKPKNSQLGWLEKADTESWKSMLVMKYAPRGQRGRVPFFGDIGKLTDLVEGHDATFDVTTEIAAGTATGRGIIAVEPDGAMVANKKPYLMPIFDFQFAEFGNETLEPTMLISVGGLNMTGGPPAIAGDGNAVPDLAAPPQVPSLEDFKIGVAFLIDTTQSMGPYIEQTRQIVRDVYERLESDGTLDKVMFGVVGYRDDVSYNSDIEYVTRIFQDFDPHAPPQQVLQRMKELSPATASTAGWDEDAWAGSLSAINELSWNASDLSARLLILISDAGARNEGDPRASVRYASAAYVAEAARQKGIAILPIHLRTPEAQHAENLGSAEQEYRRIGETGDEGINKYVGVDAGDIADFAHRLSDAAQQVAIAVRQSANNERMERPNFEPPTLQDEEVPQTDLGQFLVNEVFRAQLEYIGTRGEERAPRFHRAWAADRDLARPQLDSLDPSVFLTRNQMNGLAKSLRDIVVRAKAADVDPASFFDLLQSLAATTSMDPTIEGQPGEFSNLAESGLLPSFLEELPYRSDVLLLDRQRWQDMGLTGREEFIGSLETKLDIYQLINDSPGSWFDLGAGDPALTVSPLPLIYLP